MFKKNKSTTDPKKLWEAFLKASIKQDWEKAKDTLQSIIKLEPNNSRTHLKMGDLLQKMGKTKGAIKSYHRSASLLIKSGFGQKAVALYKIILRLDPNDEEALSGSKDLLSTAMGESLPSFSPDESPPLKQAAPEAAQQKAQAEEVTEDPLPEEPAPSEAMPPAVGMPETTEGMPTPSGWPEADEVASEQAPTTDDWPGEGGVSATWPEEDGNASELDETSAMPDIDLDIPQEKDAESILGLYNEPKESKQAEPDLPPLDIEGPNATGAEPLQWSGTLPEIFWSLTKEELAQIANESTVRTYHKGDVIVKEGDSGDSIYAIVQGHANVATNFDGQSVDLASLREGDVFGEVAFLSGKPRTATVVAESETRVVDIGRSVLQSAIDKHPRILSCLAEYYHNRVRDTLTKVKRAKKPKSRFIIKD